MKTTKKDDPQTITANHLADTMGVLENMLDRVRTQLFEATGAAKITWSDAADAERILNDLLDIEQRAYYAAANVEENEGGEAVARQMALDAARETFKKIPF